MRLSISISLLMLLFSKGVVAQCQFDAGQIGPDQVVCIGATPDPIGNVQAPAASLADLQVVWISTTTPPDAGAAVWTPIAGWHELWYQPGPVDEPTWFRRCVRLQSCEEFMESNIVAVIPEACPAPCPDLEAQITAYPTSCYQSPDGTALIDVSGGTPPYTISWPDGEEGAVRETLTAGIWTVTITDAAGCSLVDSFTITSPPPIEIEVVTTPASCGDSNGTAEALVSGGTEPWFFQWSHGPNKSSIGGMAAGTYLLTVTDANGCTAVTEVIITDSCTLGNLTIQYFQATPLPERQRVTLEWAVPEVWEGLIFRIDRYQTFEGWQPIGEVSGEGADGSQVFRFEDPRPPAGHHRYRLRLLDPRTGQMKTAETDVWYHDASQPVVQVLPKGDKVCLRWARPLPREGWLHAATRDGRLLGSYHLPEGASETLIEWPRQLELELVYLRVIVPTLANTTVVMAR